MAGSKSNRSSRYSRKNMYSVKDGAKWISYTDGSKVNRDGSCKTTGYIPNTKENRDKLTALFGRPDRFDDRLMWS